jgi:predicted TPR repeat methyltransferase
MKGFLMMQKVLQGITIALVCGLVAGQGYGETAETVLAKAGPSLVAVAAVDGQTGAKHLASGVVVRPHQVLTACSLVIGRSGLEVGKEGRALPATMLVADREKDLCLLAVDGLAAPQVERGGSGTLAMQASVWAVGMRGGVAAVETGVVTQLRGNRPPLIETTLLSTPETVGRGLFDREGRLVGISPLFEDEGQSLYFAAPVEWLDGLRPDNGNGVGKPIHWLKRAMMLEESERWETLRDWSRQWSTALPKEALAWHTLGYSCIVLKDPEGALAAFRHTVQINPADLDGWSNLGYAFTDLNRYPEAIRAYQEVVRINPDDVEGWSNLGMAYGASGDRVEALRAINEVRRLDAGKAAELLDHLQGL